MTDKYADLREALDHVREHEARHVEPGNINIWYLAAVDNFRRSLGPEQVSALLAERDALLADASRDADRLQYVASQAFYASALPDPEGRRGWFTQEIYMDGIKGSPTVDDLRAAIDAAMEGR